MSAAVIRLRPYYYIHVLDCNTNITRVEQGPKTFVRKDHENIVLEPEPMINIPPRHFCVIGNPALYNAGQVQLMNDGQAQLQHGEKEVRLNDDWTTPFPLHPGEYILKHVQALVVVAPQQALQVKAVRSCIVNGMTKIPGDEWLFCGPGTYIPKITENVIKTITACVIMPNSALKIKAKRNFTDKDGTVRIKGEEWLITKQGSYLPDVYEIVLGSIGARVLTEKKALHLKAERTFTDVYNVERKAGSEWIVTNEDAQTHLPDIFEKVIGFVDITILSPQQYCVVLNPVGRSGPQWGIRELRKGECQFFLKPGEKLEKGIEEAYVLAVGESLLLRARQDFDSASIGRKAGEEWLIEGPRKYIVPVEVEVIGDKRKAIPLDDNEGIYVRDLATGEIQTIKGQMYRLGTTEERWSKQLDPEIEKLLSKSGYRGQGHKHQVIKRNPFAAVTYRVPHNNACQIFDYKKKVSRVIIGPEMIMLEPFEEFTVISLSAGQPKQENMIKSLGMALGPDFMTDKIVVETSDHARLSLILAYNWHFEYNRDDEKEREKLFSVRDFVGDACKALASRVRGAVALQTFDNFHKSSSEIIRKAVFGKDSEGVPKKTLKFHSNLLLITNVDIQTVEPVEQRTRDALAESVKLAIEITRQSREKMASHLASKEEQIARDDLEQQKIRDQANAEVDRKVLVKLKAETRSAAAIGKAKAEANARVEEAMIMADAAVKQAKQKVKAKQIRATARLEQLKRRQEQQIEHQKGLDKIEIERAKKEAEIETRKFKDIVGSIGPETIEAIARAGPEMQAKLLEGLGLQGFLVTDGTSPINLFNTANGLVGGARS